MVYVAWVLIVGTWIVLALAAWDQHKCLERQQARTKRWKELGVYHRSQYQAVVGGLSEQEMVIRGMQKTLASDTQLLAGADNLLRKRCEACETTRRDAC
jgi:hypothetical protein